MADETAKALDPRILLNFLSKAAVASIDNMSGLGCQFLGTTRAATTQVGAPLDFFALQAATAAAPAASTEW